MLPPLKLDAAVHEYVRNTFGQYQVEVSVWWKNLVSTRNRNVVLVNCSIVKFYGSVTLRDADKDKELQQLLKILGTPPMFTTLRVNTLRDTRVNMREIIQTQIDKQYLERNRRAPTITDHPLLDDTIVIPNSGPMLIQQVDKKVIVGLGCGVAVLRGANVFAQGIMGAPSNMCQGDNVSVYADVEGGCKRGFVKQFDGATVFVGNGIAEISRHHLFCTTEKIRGVAIRMTEPLYEAPSLSDLSPEIVFPQNLPSIVCTRVLDPQPGERILDMCAAPGGKTTHMASLMKNQGRVVALDKSTNKREKLLTNVQHWSASCVDVYISDSSKCISGDAETSGPPLYPPGSFDRVLLDAPCSALGQRPSCRNKMTLAEVKSYPALQRKIFTKAVEAVKVGGVIVYSTCTIPVEENEHQVAWALQQFPCLRLEQQTPYIGGQGRRGNKLTDEQCTLVQRFEPSCVTVVTPAVDSDTIGFFIAKFVKLYDPMT